MTIPTLKADGLKERIANLVSAAPDRERAMVYLIGAGGCGMSGLGHIFLDLGHVVRGSDLAEGTEVKGLRERGAQIAIGHAPENLGEERPDLLIYSSAIRLDNPELAMAREWGVRCARRGEVLAALAGQQASICVAGMHGKTTTSSLLAYALGQLDARPSWAIGALVPQLRVHARFDRPDGDTEGRYFVLEADESDGTLREFTPSHSIILNVDAEHLDHYGDVDEVCREFAQFARQTKGNVIYCADDSRLRRLLGGWGISFGMDETADYRIEMAELVAPVMAGPAVMEGTSFRVLHRGTELGGFSISLMGEQNVSNATAVIAMLHQLGFGAGAIAGAIRGFRGAARRQEVLLDDGQVRVMDDYGHHPTEIRATLRALRQAGSKRLVVAFQPHRYSRTRLLREEFASCFSGADRLLITEVYAASEQAVAGVDGAGLAEAVRDWGQAAEFVSDVARLPVELRKDLRPGDLVLFLGAGDITRQARLFAAELRAEAKGARDRLYLELVSRLSPESLWRRDEILAKRTTLRVGGAADLYVEPASERDLSVVVRFCHENALPYVVLGRGSNLLICDGGIRGVVICLGRPEFCSMAVRGGEIHCGAGVRLKAVAIEAKRHGIAGLEFLEGIPGSVGGALRMNAGAMGGAMFNAVRSIRFMDAQGVVHERMAADVEVEYRKCALLKTHIALGAVLAGTQAPSEEIARRMQSCSEKRWKSQPAAPSAGCIFKNPAQIAAGKLIEELGLKGTRIGGAMISDVHGNFIVNDGHASAEDVLSLIALVKQAAKVKRGIDLETEVEILGERTS